jgi:hypothetical protein
LTTAPLSRPTSPSPVLSTALPHHLIGVLGAAPAPLLVPSSMATLAAQHHLSAVTTSPGRATRFRSTPPAYNLDPATRPLLSFSFIPSSALFSHSRTLLRGRHSFVSAMPEIKPDQLVVPPWHGRRFSPPLSLVSLSVTSL